MKILIKNGRVIDPANKVDRKTDLLIVGEEVEKIGRLDGDADTVIDAEGKLVTPGLIDIHVHFREPGDEEEETIASGSAAAVAGGFTSVVCMPNTNPPIDEATSVEYIHRMGRQARKTFIYVMGAITKNREGVELAEMGLMSQAGAIGFTDDGDGVQDTSVMLRALKYAAMFDRVVAQHCQDDALAKGVMNSGYNSTKLGLPGIDPLAEEMMLWRDIQLVKKTNTRYHAHHISTAGSVEIIKEAKAKGLPVTCEVTPHHLLLTDDAVADYDTYYKVNPPLRTEEDVKALKKAIAAGLIDALATDHAPHLRSEKELEFLAAPFGIASLECALSLYVKALIEPGVLPSISRATRPTASPLLRTIFVPLRTATTEGSFKTMPLSRTQTRVVQVPRSIPISVLNQPNNVSNIKSDSLHAFRMNTLYTKWLRCQ